MPDDKSYSKNFLQYADLLRQATQGERSPEKLTSLLNLPATVWNAVILDEIKGTKHVQEILDHLESLPNPQRDSGKKMVEYWIDRKKTQFGNHKWSVEHFVRVKDGQLMVLVQAKDIATNVRH